MAGQVMPVLGQVVGRLRTVREGGRMGRESEDRDEEEAGTPGRCDAEHGGSFRQGEIADGPILARSRGRNNPNPRPVVPGQFGVGGLSPGRAASAELACSPAGSLRCPGTDCIIWKSLT